MCTLYKTDAGQTLFCFTLLILTRRIYHISSAVSHRKSALTEFLSARRGLSNFDNLKGGRINGQGMFVDVRLKPLRSILQPDLQCYKGE